MRDGEADLAPHPSPRCLPRLPFPSLAASLIQTSSDTARPARRPPHLPRRLRPLAITPEEERRRPAVARTHLPHPPPPRPLSNSSTISSADTTSADGLRMLPARRSTDGKLSASQLRRPRRGTRFLCTPASRDSTSWRRWESEYYTSSSSSSSHLLSRYRSLG